MTSRIYVFLGSTLPPAEARRHLPDAEYLPPIQQGDILRLLPHEPRVIGIVDGLFRAIPSVWHKEILTALDRGCHVFGASSMGALRAAELHTHGMRGVGRIFESFVDGTYEDDDEVAVAHASAEHGFRELSFAMANIRDVLARACDAKVLDDREEAELVAHAKATFYPERTARALVSYAGKAWSKDRADALEAFLESAGPTQKERDAVEMLQAIRSFVATDPPPFVPTRETPRTIFLHQLEREVEATRAPRRAFDDKASLSETGLPLHALRREALTQIVGRGVGPQLDCEATETEIDMAIEQLWQSAKLFTEDERARWLDERGVRVDILRDRLRDMITLQKLEARFQRQVDVELPDLAAVLSAFRG